jgi:uncharacterized repeat protein (TIGR03803 family)
MKSAQTFAMFAFPAKQLSTSALLDPKWRRSLVILFFTALLAFPAFAAARPTLLHTFTGGDDGSYPDSNLVEDANGNLYGTTQIGGVYGFGTIFELSPTENGNWRFSVLYTFTGGSDGGNPLGSLTLDQGGNAYATVSSGGENGLGAIIELSPPSREGKQWTETVLYSFQGGEDGGLPFGAVIFDAAGNLYGTTSIGGKNHVGCPPARGCGTIFQLTPNGDGSWNKRVLHEFSDAFGEGAAPRVGLTIDAAGNLYGTTYEGGNNDECEGYGCGTVFQLSPTDGRHWAFKNLIDFNGRDAALAGGGVIINNGALYGTALYGGENNQGVIYSLTQDADRWKFAVEYSFDGLDGLRPSGNLAFDTAGNLYGATYEGGANDWGSIFQLLPGTGGWTENILYSFVTTGRGYGANPLGGVIIDGSGNLYLTANQGGSLKYCQPNSGCGTVIRFETSQE